MSFSISSQSQQGNSDELRNPQQEWKDSPVPEPKQRYVLGSRKRDLYKELEGGYNPFDPSHDPHRPETWKNPLALKVEQDTVGPKAKAALQDFRLLLGGFVPELLKDETGALDLSRIQAKDFEEFRNFLCDQAALNDNKSFRNPYEKLLRSPTYTQLLHGLFQLKQTGEVGREFFGKEELLADTVDEFQKDLISIDAEAFSQRFLASKAGRQRIHRLFATELGLDKDQKADLAKGILAAAEGQGQASDFEAHQIRSAISSFNYFNWGVSEDDLKQATLGAQSLLASGDYYEEVHEELEKRFLSGRSAEKLGGRSFTPEEIQKYQALAQDEGAGAVGQLRAKLAGVWLMAANPGMWTVSVQESEKIRGYLLEHAEKFLAKLDRVSNQKDFEAVLEELDWVLRAPIPLEDKRYQDYVWHNLKKQDAPSLVAKLPAKNRAALDDLVQLKDHWKYSVLECGERLRVQEPELKVEDPQIKQQLQQAIRGLEKTKHELWYGYKQHKALSRLASNAADLGEMGNIAKIRAANKFLDGQVAKLIGAVPNPPIAELEQNLYQAMRQGGVLYEAMSAAELDGAEQLIGLAQTVAVMAALAAASRGVSVALRGAQASAEAGTVAAGAGTAARAGAVLNTGAKVVQAGSRTEKMLTGFRMGANLATAENILAVASGEVRRGPESAEAWLKDSMATGLAMALSAGVVPMSEPAKQTLMKNLFLRYTAGGLKGAKHFLADTGLEIVEEVIDAYTRQVLDGNTNALTWNELEELVKVCLAGGGAKVGVLAEHLKGGTVGSKTIDSKQNPHKKPEAETLNQAQWERLEKIKFRSHIWELAKPILETTLEGMRNTGWSAERKFQLLISLAENGQADMGLYYNLPRALQALQKTGWDIQQQSRLLNSLAKAIGPDSFSAFGALSEALPAIQSLTKNFDQTVEWLVFLAEHTRVNVGNVFRSFPAACEAMKPMNWTPEQKLQLFGLLVKKARIRVDRAFEELPAALQALKEEGRNEEQIFQALLLRAESADLGAWTILEDPAKKIVVEDSPFVDPDLRTSLLEGNSSYIAATRELFNDEDFQVHFEGEVDRLFELLRDTSDGEAVLVRDISEVKSTADNQQRIHITDRLVSILENSDPSLRLRELSRLRRELYERHPNLAAHFQVLAKRAAHRPVDLELHSETSEPVRTRLLGYSSAQGQVRLRTETGKVIEMPAGMAYGLMTEASARALEFPSIENWAYGKTTYYRYSTDWKRVREHRTAEGDFVVVKSDMPLDHALPFSPETENAETDLRNQVRRFPVLRKLGFALDPQTLELTLPSVEVLNHLLSLHRQGNPRVPSPRFETSHYPDDTPRLIYARRLAQDIHLLGVGTMKVHDYDTHMIDHLATPDEFRRVFNAKLKLWLEILDHPVLGRNEMLRQAVEKQIDHLISEKDNALAQDFIGGFMASGWSEDYLTDRERSPRRTFWEYLRQNSETSAQDELAAFLAGEAASAAPGIFKMVVDNVLKEEFQISLTEAEVSILRQISARADGFHLTPQVLKLILLDPRYRSWISEEPAPGSPGEGPGGSRSMTGLVSAGRLASLAGFVAEVPAFTLAGPETSLESEAPTPSTLKLFGIGLATWLAADPVYASVNVPQGSGGFGALQGVLGALLVGGVFSWIGKALRSRGTRKPVEPAAKRLPNSSPYRLIGETPQARAEAAMNDLLSLTGPLWRIDGTSYRDKWALRKFLNQNYDSCRTAIQNIRTHAAGMEGESAYYALRGLVGLAEVYGRFPAVLLNIPARKIRALRLAALEAIAEVMRFGNDGKTDPDHVLDHLFNPKNGVFKLEFWRQSEEPSSLLSKATAEQIFSAAGRQAEFEDFEDIVQGMILEESENFGNQMLALGSGLAAGIMGMAAWSITGPIGLGIGLALAANGIIIHASLKRKHAAAQFDAFRSRLDIHLPSEGSRRKLRIQSPVVSAEKRPRIAGDVAEREREQEAEAEREAENATKRKKKPGRKNSR